MTDSTPDRISPDALIETLVEFQFSTDVEPEVVLGRLLDSPDWNEFHRTRLPLADMPQPIRESDPHLRFLPLFELKSTEKGRQVRCGGRVLSYHVLAPYPGWKIFRNEINLVIERMYDKLGTPSISRVGFRYLNIFTKDKHFVSSISDLHVKVEVGGEYIADSINVNYIDPTSPSHLTTVRIATPDFVQNSPSRDFSIFCDIDVSTKPGIQLTSQSELREWIDVAHDLEKLHFFRILGKENTRRLERGR